jgi:hypothetical protein
MSPGLKRFRICQPDDIHRHCLKERPVVTQFTERLSSPAFQPGDSLGAGMLIADGNSEGAVEVGHLDRVAAIRGGVISKLSRRIVSPASRALSNDGAGGRCSGCDCSRGSVQSEDLGWQGVIDGGAVTKLAKEIVAPALDRAIIHQCASERAACGNRQRGAIQSRHLHWLCAMICGCAIAQLPG